MTSNNTTTTNPVQSPRDASGGKDASAKTAAPSVISMFSSSTSVSVMGASNPPVHNNNSGMPYQRTPTPIGFEDGTTRSSSNTSQPQQQVRRISSSSIRQIPREVLLNTEANTSIPAAAPLPYLDVDPRKRKRTVSFPPLDDSNSLCSKSQRTNAMSTAERKQTPISHSTQSPSNNLTSIPNHSTSTTTTTVTSTSATTTTSTTTTKPKRISSIPRAVRRRFQSMIRGTRLVPRQLPPIVVSSASQNQQQQSRDCGLWFSKEHTHLTQPSVPQPPMLVEEDPHQLFLRTHTLLGRGAFASVTSVTVEKRRSNTALEATNPSSVINSPKYYYACKSIRDELFGIVAKTTDKPIAELTEQDKKHRRAYVQAESQLAYEAHVLSSLDHPHIIRLLGYFPASDTASASNNSGSVPPPLALTKPERSVLLTELLDETLSQKIAKWRKSSATTQVADVCSRNLEKLTVCQQLASALEYLHSHGIAYRDLKPENVGFLKDPGNGTSSLKLFDFGLSREMNTTASIPPGHERTESPAASAKVSVQPLRGIIGTMRYMAPEVCLDQPYDCDCDVYSYAVLSWEIWTHRTPYALLTPDSYKQRVCLQGLRPPDAVGDPESPCAARYDSLPRAVGALLAQAWCHEPSQRIRWSGIRQQLTRMVRVVELWKPTATAIASASNG